MINFVRHFLYPDRIDQIFMLFLHERNLLQPVLWLKSALSKFHDKSFCIIRRNKICVLFKVGWQRKLFFMTKNSNICNFIKNNCLQLQKNAIIKCDGRIKLGWGQIQVTYILSDCKKIINNVWEQQLLNLNGPENKQVPWYCQPWNLCTFLLFTIVYDISITIWQSS